MKKLLLPTALVIATLASAGLAQNATAGYWELPGTKFGGYFGVRAVQPNGTVRGDNPEPVYTGATAVVVYEFQVGGKYDNVGMVPGPESCRKIEAELIKNERSVLRYFHKLPAGALKPQPFSSTVHADMVKPHTNLITEVVGGTTAGHTRCYVRVDKAYRRPNRFMVIGTYRK
jgi:hypothetical protein